MEKEPAVANVVVGKCVPMEEAAKKILPVIGEILEGFKEAYLLTEGVSAAVFKGRVEDGKTAIPQCMQHLFDGKEVFVGVFQIREPPIKEQERGYRMEIANIAELLKIGIRPLRLPEMGGRVRGAFALIPTHEGQWIREHAQKIGDPWEGSYIPLSIDVSGKATIIVGRGLETEWESLAEKLSKALGVEVLIKGD